MAAAVIVIDQPAHPTQPIGQPGKSRNDIVLGTPVQLRNQDDTGVRSHRWLILDQPDLATPDVLSNPIAATPTFTPNAIGTYRIQLSVNLGRKGEVDRQLVAVRDFSDQRQPAAGEADEANWDDVDTAAPNARGWMPDVRDLLRKFDNRGSPVTTPSAASGGGTAEGEIFLGMAAPTGSQIEIIANSNTVLTDVELFADAARSILVYQALAKDAFTTPFEDGTPFALFRPMANLELRRVYYRLTNNGANPSTYSIRLRAKA